MGAASEAATHSPLLILCRAREIVVITKARVEDVRIERTSEVSPSLPSPSALPYQVAVAGCHSGSTTLCAAPDASPAPKRHEPQTSDASSTPWTEKKQAPEDLEEEPAMARART